MLGADAARNSPIWLGANQLAAELKASLVSPNPLCLPGLPFLSCLASGNCRHCSSPALFIPAFQITLHTLIKPCNAQGRKAKGAWGRSCPAPLGCSAGPHTRPAQEAARDNFPLGRVRAGCQGARRFHTPHASLRVTCPSSRTTAHRGVAHRSGSRRPLGGGS